MIVMNSKIENLLRCEMGGGGAKATPPPPPPTRNKAADNTKDLGISKRKGYQSTILGGGAAPANNPLKTLLGS